MFSSENFKNPQKRRKLLNTSVNRVYSCTLFTFTTLPIFPSILLNRSEKPIVYNIRGVALSLVSLISRVYIFFIIYSKDWGKLWVFRVKDY